MTFVQALHGPSAAQLGPRLICAVWLLGALALGIVPAAPLGENLALSVVWLVLALGAVACLVVLASASVHALTRAVARLPGCEPADAVRIARVLWLALAVLVAQTVIRRPLGLVLGTLVEPQLTEAIVAALALAIALLALARLHVLAYPVLLVATRRFLDSFVATSEGAELAPEPAPAAAEAPRPAPSPAEPTQPAPSPAEPTLPAPGDATPPAPSDATQPVQGNSDMTLPAQHESDATLAEDVTRA